MRAITTLADTAPPTLRARLVEMREALITGMTAATAIEPGHLALLGHVGAALAAIEAADK